MTGSLGETHDVNNKMFPGFHLQGKEQGLDMYTPEKKTHIHDEENNIKIIHIGQQNNLPIRNVLMIGETGAGKTTLLNALYNHFCAVKFEDGHRMKLFEEDDGCQGKEFYESQTEAITGYLFFSQCPMRNNFNVMVIDTPGLNDTRGTDKQHKIITQMQVFLKEEKFGVADLHSLAFVVKADLNRRLEYFGKIIEECMKLFGNDTKNITQILKTHAVDRKKGVGKIFQQWGIHTEQEFSFDNGVLYEANKTGEKDTDGNITEGCDLDFRKIRWNKQTKECDMFFQILFQMPSVSLRLTRVALKEKTYLEQAKQNLSVKIESILNEIAAHRENKKMLKDYEKSMEENKVWRGKETIIEKEKVPLSQDRRWYQFSAHVHNCIKCNKTCSPICHIWIPCPSLTDTCVVCNCKINVHAKSDEVIKENLTVKNITDEDMKAKFKEAESLRAEVEKIVSNLEKEEEMLKLGIATMIKHISLQLERLNQISRITTQQTPKEIIDEVIHSIIQNNTNFKTYLDDDCNAFLQSVFAEVDKIEINKDAWIKELEDMMDSGDSAWDRAKNTVQRVTSNAGQMMGFPPAAQVKGKRISKIFDVTLRHKSKHV